MTDLLIMATTLAVGGALGCALASLDLRVRNARARNARARDAR